MITPPETASCFYSAHFEQSAAQFMIGLLAESFAVCDDVNQVLITSTDFRSDIEAASELRCGLEEVSVNLVDDDADIEFITKYNPIFLPNVANLLDIAELDDKGDIIMIDGFASPYISMMTSVSTDETPNIIEAKVLYKQFELPALHIELGVNKEVLLS